MRSTTKLMKNWQFTGPDGKTAAVDLPHTWNNIDGQDGGNDYWRGTCIYKTRFAAPAFDKNTQQVWLQFEGVNASAKVTLNGVEVARHDGGYSTFRADVTALLADSNELIVEADNSKNDRVYPQKADFTFYGGIYRDVSLLVVNRNHIALGYFGGPGVQITPAVNGANADIEVKTWMEGDGEVEFSIYDATGAEVLTGKGWDTTVTLEHPHLWDGVRDPYLYTCVVRLVQDGEVDEVTTRVGLRSFSVDPKKGFFLNGRPIRCTACPAIRTARVWAMPSPGRCTMRIWRSSGSWAQTPSGWRTTSTTSTSTTCATSTAWWSGLRSPTFPSICPMAGKTPSAR